MIKDKVAPERFIIVTQEKAWMNQSMIFTWLENVWQTCAKEKAKGIRL